MNEHFLTAATETIKMKSTYIFPIAMIAMNIGAAIVCIVNKEYKKAVYWIAAAVLNAAVTF